MVFGGAISIARNQLNNRIVGQILNRQAEVLQAIALVHQVGMIESSAGLSMENPADQLLVMEELSELSGALGFRLYSPESDYILFVPGNHHGRNACRCPKCKSQRTRFKRIVAPVCQTQRLVNYR